MKKALFFIISLLFSSLLLAQNENFSIVLQNNASDNVLVGKLKRFKDRGIEQPLEIDSLVSPDSLIAIAKTFKGTPHRMGGTTKNGIDCSGLLFATFNTINVKIPHGSEALAHYGTVIPTLDSLQRGDLVFFIKSYRTSKTITHSGIYLGEGNMIHTSSRNGVVIINMKNSSYWKPKFIFGTRVF